MYLFITKESLFNDEMLDFIITHSSLQNKPYSFNFISGCIDVDELVLQRYFHLVLILV
jgi:hypothetical protein